MSDPPIKCATYQAVNSPLPSKCPKDHALPVPARPPWFTAWRAEARSDQARPERWVRMRTNPGRGWVLSSRIPSSWIALAEPRTGMGPFRETGPKCVRVCTNSAESHRNRETQTQNGPARRVGLTVLTAPCAGRPGRFTREVAFSKGNLARRTVAGGPFCKRSGVFKAIPRFASVITLAKRGIAVQVEVSL